MEGNVETIVSSDQRVRDLEVGSRTVPSSRLLRIAQGRWTLFWRESVPGKPTQADSEGPLETDSQAPAKM